MTFMIDVDKMPRNVLETAVKFNDPLKKIYVTSYFFREPATPKKSSQKAGICESIRAYTTVLTRIHGFS